MGNLLQGIFRVNYEVYADIHKLDESPGNAINTMEYQCNLLLSLTTLVKERRPVIDKLNLFAAEDDPYPLKNDMTTVPEEVGKTGFSLRENETMTFISLNRRNSSHCISSGCANSPVSAIAHKYLGVRYDDQIYFTLTLE